MYRKHQSFVAPDDENVKIWRYLDLAKFVSILDRRSLFFVRADKLRDPFEGKYPKTDLDKYKTKYGGDVKDIDKLIQLLERTTAERKKYILISSWNMSEYESAALWKVFLKSDEGVAIQSTYAKLRDCFAGFNDDIHIGKVRYIDYEAMGIPKEATLSPLNPFILKRKSFEYEQEIRAIYRNIAFQEDNNDEPGSYVPVDLDLLIEKVFVSPTAPQWYGEVIQSLVKKYGIEKEVVHSNLWQGAVY